MLLGISTSALENNLKYSLCAIAHRALVLLAGGETPYSRVSVITCF